MGGKLTLQTPHQRRIAEAVLRHHVGDTYDFSATAEELKGVSKTTISLAARALKERDWKLPDALDAKQAKQPAKQAEQAGGELATITQPKPAAIQFSFGQQKIDLDPMIFTKSYLLYLDMQARLGLTDSFSAAIYDSISFMWRLLTTRPQVEDNQVDLLVTTRPNTPQEEIDQGG